MVLPDLNSPSDNGKTPETTECVCHSDPCKCSGDDTLNGKPLRNFITGNVLVDTLHKKATKFHSDTDGSSDVYRGNLVNEERMQTVKDRSEIVIEAKAFLKEYFESLNHSSTNYVNRFNEVVKEVESNGTYDLTPEELTFAAQSAWRNAARCVGRVHWNKLQVFDCRSVKTTEKMFEALLHHLKFSINGGNVRPTCSIFPQTRNGEEFRIWNRTLIGYAGYRAGDGTVIGDPLNVGFTEVCLKLGWKGKGTRFDVLPLVLQADDKSPDFYKLPDNVVIRILLEHPTFDGFKQLNLEWFPIPVFSNMKLDCGGIEYCTAFSTWYVVTDVAIRNLLDPQRYNLSEEVASKLNIEMTNFWKDQVALEMLKAVMYSFQKYSITIVDHHSASEAFMKHFENEHKIRGGCPADWRFIVPPTAGSLTTVFHQEMLSYTLKPSFEYQLPAWSDGKWNNLLFDESVAKDKLQSKTGTKSLLMSSGLLLKQMEKKVKCLVLYATETGKSECFAYFVGQLFSHAFHVTVLKMEDYEISKLEYECLVLVVASTFGNGEPPENATSFVRGMQKLIDSQNVTRKPKSLRSEQSLQELNILPKLCNLSYAVFALGSSAYPKYCFFGKFVDLCFRKLGAKRLMKIHYGDDLCGQDMNFRKWNRTLFQESCKSYDIPVRNRQIFDQIDEAIKWSSDKVKLVPTSTSTPVLNGLEHLFKKKLYPCVLSNRRDLFTVKHKFMNTISVQFNLQHEPAMEYKPGDHVAIFAANRKVIVDSILERVLQFNSNFDPDAPIEVQERKIESSSDGSMSEVWKVHERLPQLTLRIALTRYVDITTPPTQYFLSLLAMYCDKDEQQKMMKLAADVAAYEAWKSSKYPNIEDILREFKSCKPSAELLLTCLPYLQPRFYSVSSSIESCPNALHLTLAVVRYFTEDKSTKHYGVCSTYLKKVNIGQVVAMCIEKNPHFKMPDDVTKPILMVGPGTGIAPFRSFWQQREIQFQRAANRDNKTFGEFTLFMGCRNPETRLYEDELLQLHNSGIFTEIHVAFSRYTETRKTYVQDKLMEYGDEVMDLMLNKDCHLYVCGDILMACGVEDIMKQLVTSKLKLTPEEAYKKIDSWKGSGKYMEDVFGVVLRTAEVTKSSKQSAEKRFKELIAKPLKTTSAVLV